MWAVVETGGKQYRVMKGDKICTEKIAGKKGDQVVLESVLMLSDGDNAKVQIGQPTISKAKVKAKIIEQGKGSKVTILKHKPKKRYKVKTGYRQPYTKLEITNIENR